MVYFVFLGTQKVIDACIECNVPYLIYISGSDVAVGSDPIYYGSENTTVIPKKHLLGPYSKTKYEAEQIVLESNKRSLANGIWLCAIFACALNHTFVGGKLITLALRPTLIYGEEDKHFLTKMLSIAKSYSGVLRRVDNIFVRGHPVYAGNVATACLQAMNKMQQDPNLGGEQFFITDDTRIVDPFEFFDPYLKARGFQLSERQYPYWLFIMIFAFFTWFLKLFSMTNLLNLPSDLTPPIVRYICNTYFFNRNKATLRLDYEPAFNHDEAQERSMPYYKSVAIWLKFPPPQITIILLIYIYFRSGLSDSVSIVHL